MDDITDLIVNKKQANVESRSFIFSPEFIKRLYSRNEVMESNQDFALVYSILTDLVKYGNHDLFVVTTEHNGLISLDALPLEINYRADTRHIVGTIGLSLNQPNVFPVAVVQDIRNSIAMMNLVLTQIVPGLTIGVETLGKGKLQDNQDGERFELVSYKSNAYIPLKYESEGIRKIISVLGLLISVYNRKSITVAIDELDSGIFEYLLGEILRIISEKGEGQLIFTSHNLRPLETLDKGCIAFTTTNPSNRYTRMVNVKTSNNLRDFYYRDIMLGEQNEELYKSTNNAEISYAFRKAGAYKIR
ncbi:AAA family ATPase [Veillonella atypica]|uniref:AAA family ATPase n=1 Tax=Veillonella atypica TaxID=39777 RepID=UPI001FC96847|nr:AAA family ATPase [Veillonella atypica]